MVSVLASSVVGRVLKPLPGQFVMVSVLASSVVGRVLKPLPGQFVIVSVLASSVVGRVLKPLPGQFEDYTIGICCFFAKHAPLMNKTNDWLDRDHVSEWGDMSTHALLFQ